MLLALPLGLVEGVHVCVCVGGGAELGERTRAVAVYPATSERLTAQLQS